MYWLDGGGSCTNWLNILFQREDNLKIFNSDINPYSVVFREYYDKINIKKPSRFHSDFASITLLILTATSI